MATSELTRPNIALRETTLRREVSDVSATSYYARTVIEALASLRLTVALFAAAIFLIFAG